MVARKRADRGLDSKVRMRDDAVSETHFDDPNGINVQIQDESCCIGSDHPGLLLQLTGQ